jgi:hypothetical protein
LRSWQSGNLGSFHRDTFYVRLVPETVAQAEAARARIGI